jgi:hypothetical protein
MRRNRTFLSGMPASGVDPGPTFVSSSADRWVCRRTVIRIAQRQRLTMLLVKQSYFTGVSYHTYSGEVDPDRQLAFILGHPFAYLATFLRTLFMTPFFPQALLGILGGAVRDCSFRCRCLWSSSASFSGL